MRKGAAVVFLLIGLVLGFAGGVMWGPDKGEAPAQEKAKSPDRRTLTALGKGGDQELPEVAAVSEGISLDADALRRRFAHLPLKELLELANTPAGQFELHAYFSTLGADQLARFGEKVMGNSTLYDPGHFYLLRTLYGSWAAVSPKDAVEHALNSENRNHRLQQFRVVFDQVLAADPDYAKEIVASLDDYDLIHPARQKIWEYEAANDPQTFFDQVEAGEHEMDEHRFGHLMQVWSRDDAEAAIARADGMKPGSFRTQAMIGIMTHIARKEPQEAIIWIDRLSSPTDRRQLASTMAVWMAHSTPEIAAEWITRETDASTRSGALSNLISNWTNSDPAGAMDFAQTLEGEERQYALHAVLADYAKEHPERAAQIHDTEIEERDREVTNAIARSWAHRDPEAAAAWVDGLPRDEFRAGAQTSFLEAWSQRDPTAASVWMAAQSSDLEGRNTLVAILARNLIRTDPEEALVWSLEVPEQNHGRSLVERAAIEWVAQDRAAAEAALTSGDWPEAARNALAEQLAGGSE